jgi:G6PDH family F420-dependent oxidoreductase
LVGIGYFLSGEELAPVPLVDAARQAEAAGFDRVWVSDHFHPWLDAQGESPFVWSVLGAIAATTNLQMTTAVTCPTFRIHPALLAQAAATIAALLRVVSASALGRGRPSTNTSSATPGRR